MFASCVSFVFCHYIAYSASCITIYEYEYDHTQIFSQVRHTYVTKGTYAFIYSYYTYSTGDGTYPIISYIHAVLSCIGRGTRWFEPVIPVASVAIRALITTTLHELKTAFGREQTSMEVQIRGLNRCPQGRNR